MADDDIQRIVRGRTKRERERAAIDAASALAHARLHANVILRAAGCEPLPEKSPSTGTIIPELSSASGRLLAIRYTGSQPLDAVNASRQMKAEMDRAERAGARPGETPELEARPGQRKRSVAGEAAA